ncbi:MAG: WG repeat-containing protein [Gammaproteobacteria bacterium]
MRNILFLIVIFSNTVNADAPWIAFWDEGKTLIGYKDATGAVRIEPRFGGFTTAYKFNNIIAVMEEKNNRYLQYYLLKNGEQIEFDNVYISDSSYDCESEQTIRFRDNKSKKVGYLNHNGKIKIPAIYDNTTSFRNGLAVAIKNSTKMCFNKIEYSDANRCEHWYWEGGETVLINKDNAILLTDFKNSTDLDFYSFNTSRFSSNKPYISSFITSNGDYFTFVNIKKHFNNWLFNSLLTDLSINNLNRYSFDEIKYWGSDKKWGSADKGKFLKNNLNLLKAELNLKINSDYIVLISGLNEYIYTGNEFKKYFNDCGDSKVMKYPVLDLVINKKLDGKNYQNSFEFLKTETSYKLISVTIRNSNLLQ